MANADSSSEGADLAWSWLATEAQVSIDGATQIVSVSLDDLKEYDGAGGVEDDDVQEIRIVKAVGGQDVLGDDEKEALKAAEISNKMKLKEVIRNHQQAPGNQDLVWNPSRADNGIDPLPDRGVAVKLQNNNRYYYQSDRNATDRFNEAAIPNGWPSIRAMTDNVTQPSDRIISQSKADELDIVLRDKMDRAAILMSAQDAAKFEWPTGENVDFHGKYMFIFKNTKGHNPILEMTNVGGIRLSLLTANTMLQYLDPLQIFALTGMDGLVYPYSIEGSGIYVSTSPVPITSDYVMIKRLLVNLPNLFGYMTNVWQYNHISILEQNMNETGWTEARYVQTRGSLVRVELRGPIRFCVVVIPTAIENTGMPIPLIVQKLPAVVFPGIIPLGNDDADDEDDADDADDSAESRGCAMKLQNAQNFKVQHGIVWIYQKGSFILTKFDETNRFETRDVIMMAWREATKAANEAREMAKVAPGVELKLILLAASRLCKDTLLIRGPLEKSLERCVEIVTKELAESDKEYPSNVKLLKSNHNNIKSLQVLLDTTRQSVESGCDYETIGRTLETARLKLHQLLQTAAPDKIFTIVYPGGRDGGTQTTYSDSPLFHDHNGCWVADVSDQLVGENNLDGLMPRFGDCVIEVNGEAANDDSIDDLGARLYRAKEGRNTFTVSFARKDLEARANMRRGSQGWREEEVKYVEAVVTAFRNRTLDLDKDVELVDYLKCKLRCTQSRLIHKNGGFSFGKLRETLLRQKYKGAGEAGPTAQRELDVLENKLRDVLRNLGEKRGV